ncbi:MAG: hypothetical protein ACJASX_001458 [Limisphaerales bacterium]|jgi:hypothetical protein
MPTDTVALRPAIDRQVVCAEHSVNEWELYRKVHVAGFLLNVVMP